MKEKDFYELEELIDRYSLSMVVQGLALIASEKADHIRSSYDDESLAKDWDRDSKKLGAVVLKLIN